MLRVNIYIKEETDSKAEMLALSLGKKKAEVVREALDAGLETMQPQDTSANKLLNFIKLAEKIPTRGKVPKDFIKNLDYYTWGGEKRSE